MRFALGGVAAALLAACGDDGGGNDGSGVGTDGQAGSADAPVTKFTIVARDLEWDLERIVVPVGAEVVATIVNEDDGINHNLHVRSPGDPATELEEGPITQTLRFEVPTAGSFEFLCDIHPATMTGTLEAVQV